MGRQTKGIGGIIKVREVFYLVAEKLGYDILTAGKILALVGICVFLGLVGSPFFGREKIPEDLRETPAKSPLKIAENQPNKIQPPVAAEATLDTQNWLAYEKGYDGILVSFRYPQGHHFHDLDHSTGIDFIEDGVGEECFNNFCGIHPRLKFMRVYDVLQHDWSDPLKCLNEEILNNRSATLARLTLGKKAFVLVKRFGVDYYYGIDNQIPYYFEDREHLFSQETIYAILDSLRILACRYNCPGE